MRMRDFRRTDRRFSIGGIRGIGPARGGGAVPQTAEPGVVGTAGELGLRDSLRPRSGQFPLRQEFDAAHDDAGTLAGFGVSASTGGGKAKAVRTALGIRRWDHRWLSLRVGIMRCPGDNGAEVEMHRRADTFGGLDADKAAEPAHHLASSDDRRAGRRDRIEDLLEGGLG